MRLEVINFMLLPSGSAAVKIVVHVPRGHEVFTAALRVIANT